MHPLAIPLSVEIKRPGRIAALQCFPAAFFVASCAAIDPAKVLLARDKEASVLKAACQHRQTRHTPWMDATDLLEAWKRKEFRPVEIHLADGRNLKLPHPDYFLLFPNHKSALVFPDGVHSESVNVAAIVRVVPTRNGKRRASH